MKLKNLILQQNLVLGLRQQIGYPLYAPSRHTMAFSSGRPVDLVRRMEMSVAAEDMQRDIVYVAFKSLNSQYCVSISLAIRERNYVDWVSNVVAWAKDETSDIVLVDRPGNQHFVLNERCQLERREGLPTAHLTAGRKLASERIRAAAAALPQELQDHNQLVPPTGWAHRVAIRQENLVGFD